MTETPVLAEVWRGSLLECVHRGTAVVCGPDGQVVEAWGDPERRILPRSACKMVQALPLVESGAAEAGWLNDKHLALACASHSGAEIHTSLAADWLAGLDLGETDLRCGPQIPEDAEARHALRDDGLEPTQLHNNCSGKHSGMLTLNRHLNGGPEYIEPEHRVQLALKDALSEASGEDLSDYAIDGCSAPNYVMSMKGLATAMAGFAKPGDVHSGARARAMARLRGAMLSYPLLVAGKGRACTTLMRACSGRAVVKTGAEGVFCAILPEAGLGIAIKIDDGSTRGSHAAITALLARFGAIEQGHPVFKQYADTPLLNRREIDCGRIRAAEVLLS
jgi:L-asparaginase II